MAEMRGRKQADVQDIPVKELEQLYDKLDAEGAVSEEDIEKLIEQLNAEAEG